MRGILSICLFRQMASQSKVIIRKVHVSFPAAPLLLQTSTPRLDLPALTHNVPTLHHQTFLLPCLTVTGPSGQADASLSAQSEAGPGPHTAVSRSICLCVCQARLLPQPLHPGAESPPTTKHLSHGIRGRTKT